jgi:type I restriction enzyme R subunit
MQDHGLFQAICRVNRIDTEDKEYGYIIDYKDLFKSLEKSITDYTSSAFDQFDENDVKGLLSNRFEVSKERLETALETVRAMCEPVYPKDEPTFIKYFCGNTENPDDIKSTEERRVALYKAVVSLIRSYSEVANEMNKLGYTEMETKKIQEEVKYFSDLRDTIKLASGDLLDFKAYEPGMRQLMDMYLDAKSSKKISDFENKTLVDLIVNLASEERAVYGTSKQQAVAETIENNVRKVIIEESQTNPKYFEKMSLLLDELIKQRKEESIEYAEYLKNIKSLAQDVTSPSINQYPSTLDSRAKQSLFDNLDKNEVLALALDNVIQSNKLDGWRDGGIKERKLRLAINNLLKNDELTGEIMEIVKAQNEY